MASSIISSATVATVSRANTAQASMVAPFTGLKSGSAFPVTRKSSDITSIATNGGRVRCMQVWPPFGKKKFETLSYLPTLTQEQLAKQIAYLLRKGWIACVEFETEDGFVHRDHHHSPGYYDGRYWTMWKLPMYGCTDPYQVLKEVEECRKAYKDAFIRIIGFDNVRQVQCISFIASKPPGSDGPDAKETRQRSAPLGIVMDKHSWAKAWIGAKSFDPFPIPPTRPDTTYL